METLLQQYNQFRECILLDVEWLLEGFRIQCTFDYIWGKPGVVRDNLDEELRVAVTFEAVRDFRIRNDWSRAMMADPERMDWGVSEIALIEVKDDSDFLRPFESEDGRGRHLAVLWEGDLRRIDVVCSQLEIHEL